MNQTPLLKLKEAIRAPGLKLPERASRKPSFKKEVWAVVENSLSTFETVLSDSEGFDSKSWATSCNAMLAQFLRRAEHQGIGKAVSVQKDLWVWSKAFALHSPTKPIPFMKTSREGVPLPIAGLVKHLRSGDDLVVSLTLTMISVHNVVNWGHPVADLSSIEGPVDKVSNATLESFRRFLRQSNLMAKAKDLDYRYSERLRVTGASGPYGPAFWSIPIERDVLRNHPLRSVIDRGIELQGLPQLKSILSHSSPLRKVKPKTLYLRRMTLVKEKAHKHRVVVIGDWFSQSVLLPIHERFMRILKGIPNDATYASHEALKKLKSLDLSFVECLDLKSFTDYLPLSLQREVVVELLGEDLKEIWERLMTEPIWFDNRFIKYTCGQPMGLLSSWAVATFTHHLLMEWAASQSRRDTSYFILGDDVVVWDKGLASSYRSVLELCSIPISEPKSISSDRGGLEFCKRMLLKDREITPLPWPVLVMPKTERYLELYRLTFSRLSQGSEFTRLREAFSPAGLASSDEESLRLYTKLLIDQPSPLKEVRLECSQEWTPRVTSKAIKNSLKVLQMGDGIGRALTFNLDKAAVRFVGTDSVSKVRGVPDDALKGLYWLVVYNYLKELDNEILDWSNRLKRVSFGHR